MNLVERIASVRERRIPNQAGRPVRELPVVASRACVHLLSPTGDTLACPTCSGNVQVKVFGCAKFGTCTAAKPVAGTACCKGCLSYEAPPTLAALPPQKQTYELPGTIKYDHTDLFPGLPGRRFNPALIRWRDQNVFCWRDGWKGSNLWICRMDDSFRPVGNATKIAIQHPNANYGREDPTLFAYRDKLHVSFVGVVGTGNRVTRTAMLYARLSDDFGVEAVYSPGAPGVPVSRWQKNWQWFSHDDDLYAIYSAMPHRILRVRGDATEWAYETNSPIKWKGGEVRGGATPVLVGGEYWSFFHDSLTMRGRKTYRVGLCTFSSAPPFRQTGFIPHSILTAKGPTDNYADVIFPRGVVIQGNTAILSCGINDRHTELIPLSIPLLRQALIRT